MDFNSIIKKSVIDVCKEIKKEDKMNVIKSDVLNPVIEHVVMQLSPYFFKCGIIFAVLLIFIIIMIFLNLRIIYK